MTTLRSPVAVVGLVIGFTFGLAFVVGGAPLWRVVVAAAIPIAYAVAVTLVGRRSETISVLAGRPVDERWEAFNLEASAWALGVTAIVALGAFAVTEAMNGHAAPYAFICAVMAVAYVGSLAIIRARS